jgi:hypothetical protein
MRLWLERLYSSCGSGLVEKIPGTVLGFRSTISEHIIFFHIQIMVTLSQHGHEILAWKVQDSPPEMTH